MTATGGKSHAAFWVIGVAALALSGIVAVLVFHESRDAPEILVCKAALEEHLKAPSTVEYDEIIHHNDEAPVASINFDSQNSFGAQIRGRAKCGFEKDGGRLVLAELTINGRPVDGTVLRVIQDTIELCALTDGC